jgi:hypothetical protein
MSHMVALDEPENISIDVSEKTLMEVFDLSSREAEFLRAMLYYAMPGPNEFPNVSRARQYIHMLRKKLEGPYHVQIWSYGNGRYGLTNSNKEKLRVFLATREE